jgi:Cof subfamily protein (haloacid dehalogenase superfamily)
MTAQPSKPPAASGEPGSALSAGPRLEGAVALLIADVDGTLVTPEKVLTPAAIAAVRRLDEAGVGFTIISSRPPRGMMAVLSQLQVRLPFASFNGGSLFTSTLDLIEAHRLPRKTASAMLALLAQRGVDAWVYADGDWRMRNIQGFRVPLEQLALGYGPMRVAGFEDVIDRIDKIVGVSDDHDLLTSVEGAARALLGGAATINRSQLYYLDVTHPQANKGDGVNALCQRIGVDLARTAVIGDMFNDVAMFAEAGFSIAMGQSPTAVKQRAQAVTSSNTEEGFARAVQQLVLPKAAGAPS